jgi:hypothetical protein
VIARPFSAPVRLAGSTAPAKLEALFETADTMFGRNK